MYHMSVMFSDWYRDPEIKHTAFNSDVNQI